MFAACNFSHSPVENNQGSCQNTHKGGSLNLVDEDGITLTPPKIKQPQNKND